MIEPFWAQVSEPSYARVTLYACLVPMTGSVLVTDADRKKGLRSRRLDRLDRVCELQQGKVRSWLHVRFSR